MTGRAFNAFLACLLAVLSLAGMARAESTLAMWDFDNNTLGTLGEIESLEPYRRIFPEALMASLVGTPGLTLVERIQLRELLDEQKLGSSELADPDSRIKLGRLLGARYMLFGDYLALGPLVRVDVRLVDSETSQILCTEQAIGEQEAVLGEMPNLALAILSCLDIQTALGAGHDASPLLWRDYERGLRLLDERRYEDAIMVFRAILELDADFKPAERQIRLALERLARGL